MKSSVPINPEDPTAADWLPMTQPIKPQKPAECICGYSAMLPVHSVGCPAYEPKLPDLTSPPPPTPQAPEPAPEVAAYIKNRPWLKASPSGTSVVDNPDYTPPPTTGESVNYNQEAGMRLLDSINSQGVIALAKALRATGEAETPCPCLCHKYPDELICSHFAGSVCDCERSAEGANPLSERIDEIFDRDCMRDKPLDADGNHEHDEAKAQILALVREETDKAFDAGFTEGRKDAENDR